jgi:hypothetical protein
MKRILLIIIIVLIAKSCLSQQPATGTKTSNTQSDGIGCNSCGWSKDNNYIIGASATILGTILINNFYKERVDTASTIEITPQFGPSTNRLVPNAELEQFHQSVGTTTGPLRGYSVGIMIAKRANRLVYKSGMFFESKGGSYTNYVNIQTDQGNSLVEIYTTSRLNYITIPFTVGAQTSGKARVGVDMGAFVSLPMSEKHQTTFNGIITEYKPTNSIGPNFGIMANLGAKIPINRQVDLSIDTRFLSSINDINGSYIIKSFNQSVQLLLGLNIRLNK